MTGAVLTSLEMSLLRPGRCYFQKKGVKKKKHSLKCSWETLWIFLRYSIISLGPKCGKFNTPTLSLPPGIAVAVLIMAFFHFWQGAPDPGGQSTQKVFPQNTPSFSLRPGNRTR